MTVTFKVTVTSLFHHEPTHQTPQRPHQGTAPIPPLQPRHRRVAARGWTIFAVQQYLHGTETISFRREPQHSLYPPIKVTMMTKHPLSEYIIYSL